jgi:hypothetical protein
MPEIIPYLLNEAGWNVEELKNAKNANGQTALSILLNRESDPKVKDAIAILNNNMIPDISQYTRTYHQPIVVNIKNSEQINKPQPADEFEQQMSKADPIPTYDPADSQSEEQNKQIAPKKKPEPSN